MPAAYLKLIATSQMPLVRSTLRKVP
jgi:hypothetical protein